jgi:hypothetical protein
MITPEPRDHGRQPRPPLDDLEDHDLKPNPLAATTLAEFEECLRELWQWAGAPPCREIARGSGGAFAHSTISKLLHNRQGKPSLKLIYVIGCIKGLGMSELEQRRWATAWRKIHLSSEGGV